MNVVEQNTEVERLRAIAEKRKQELHNAQVDLRTCEADILAVNTDKLITARLRGGALTEIMTLASQQLQAAEAQLAQLRKEQPMKLDPATVAQTVRTLQGRRGVLERQIHSLDHGGRMEVEIADTLDRTVAIQTLQQRVQAIDARLEALAAS